MASKRFSPAANILRHSKLFALPPPIRPPPTENLGGRSLRSSETSTLPHPTLPAIETTPQALSSGEWGLKRALPAKAGWSSTPVVRIDAVDNVDRITPYSSAADHVLTVEKWQEMDIALTTSQAGERPSGIFREGAPKSVFDEPQQTAAGSVRGAKQRWRFDGPWVAGMSQLDFELYLDKLSARREEFVDYLKDYLASKKSQQARSQALARGEAHTMPTARSSAKDFREGVKKLKTDHAELFSVIWKFLDIPGQPPVKDAGTSSFSDAVDRFLSDIDDTPPQTHPSAGLAYSRSANHLYNHPSLGPQRARPPIHGRIVQHSSIGNPSRSGGSLIGVGGVVGMQATETFSFRDSDRAGEYRFDHELEEGSKAWVVPKRASIDPSGRIRLSVEKASQDTVAVWEQKVPPGTTFNPNDPLASITAGERNSNENRQPTSRSYEQLFRNKDRPPVA